MSTAELKFSLHQLIDDITDSSVLQAVYTLLSKATNDDEWWENLPEESKKSIQRGIEDADNGRFVPEEKVQAKVDKLLGRRA